MKKEDDIFIFSKTIENFLKSGFSLYAAVSMLSTFNSCSLLVRKCALSICREMESGKDFSLCLKNNGFLKFPKWYISFISVSEKSGSLEVAFSYVSEIIKKRQNTREKLFTSLAYPISIVIICVIISVFLLLNGNDFLIRLGLKASVLEFERLIRSSVLFANLFLFLFCIITFLIFYKIDGIYKLSILFSMLCYTNSKNEILQGLYIFSDNYGNGRLKESVGKCCSSIESGMPFGESFSVFGNNISTYFEFSEYTSNINNSIQIVNEMIQRDYERKLNFFMKFIEPASMISLAVYFVILFGNIFNFCSKFFVENALPLL